ncbi:MAG: hypothetical protein F6K09_37670 [Merismopedia sp. SIO2A8]|nr:hypothetical protein [Merismopedia sp. SIO2A8]
MVLDDRLDLRELTLLVCACNHHSTVGEVFHEADDSTGDCRDRTQLRWSDRSLKGNLIR